MRLYILLFILLLPLVSRSEDSVYLFGQDEWRHQQSEKGYDFAVLYKGEVSQVMRGGSSYATHYLENIDLKFALNAEKAWGIPGGSFLFYGLGDRNANPDHSPAKDSGSVQGLSNIETAANALRVYELYWQQNFFADKLSLLFGLHDLNSEFYATDTSALFFNPSFGIGLDLAQTGVNGPSIFPNASLALRMKAQLSENIYFQLGGFNAQAGDPDARQTNLVVRGPANDGLLLIAELGFVQTQNMPGKYAIGTWGYTRRFDHLTETEVNAGGNTIPATANSHGSYFLADQRILEDVAVFARYGFAAAEVSTVDSSFSFGVVKTALFPGRPNDRFGVGYTQANAGSIYKDKMAAMGISTASEKIIDLNYRIELGHGLALQPDYQFITHPGLDGDASSAEYGALRLEINF